MGSVEISGIRKSYCGIVALQDINISIPEGAFFTLLGPSGCGKTTLLRMIAGFHVQDSGSIAIDRTVIDTIPVSRRDIGMVFQDYAVFPHLNVFENVAFGLRQRKITATEITSRVNAILTTVQLADYALRMPHELSGGQQQRVGLARALVINPKVLLMDEPLSNLDAKLRIDLRRELRSIQQSLNMTTIYVTHDQEEALAMSDIVCVMYGGVVQQADTAWDVYKRPSNRFVASFVGINNFLPAQVENNGVRLGARHVAIDLPPIAKGRELVAAVRPEHVSVNLATPSDEMVSIEARVAQVSFTGREVVLTAITDQGDPIEAAVAPTREILGLQQHAPVMLSFPIREIQLFEPGVTGRRLT